MKCWVVGTSSHLGYRPNLRSRRRNLVVRQITKDQGGGEYLFDYFWVLYVCSDGVTMTKIAEMSTSRNVQRH